MVVHKKANVLLYLLTICAFTSITLFEALVIIILVYYTLHILRERSIPKGILLKPLLLYAIPTLLSTALYMPQYINKGIERSIFMFVYPLGSYVKVSEKFLYTFNRMLLMMGYAFVPIVIYKFYRTGEPAPLWGGWFEVGIFYSIFSLSALSLFFKRRRYFHLLTFFLFFCFVLLSSRRSTLLALGITLAIFAFLLRRYLSFKFLVVLSVLLSFMGGSAFYLLVKKDERFGTFYQVITGQKPINDDTLNKISSLRWQNFKAGMEVVKKDMRDKNLLPLLIGHGINSGFLLEPKSPIGGTYESVIFLSEFIEGGILGLLGIVWTFISYYSFIIKCRINQDTVLLSPFLLAPSVVFAGSIFTGFWDSLLPLYLIWFRVAEKLYI